VLSQVAAAGERLQACQLDVRVLLERALNGITQPARHYDEDKSQQHDDRRHCQADVEQSYRPDTSPPSLVTQSIVCKYTPQACHCCRSFPRKSTEFTSHYSKHFVTSKIIKSRLFHGRWVLQDMFRGAQQSLFIFPTFIRLTHFSYRTLSLSNYPDYVIFLTFLYQFSRTSD